MPLIPQIFLFAAFFIIAIFLSKWATDRESVLMQNSFSLLLAFLTLNLTLHALDMRFEFSPNSVKKYYEEYDKFVTEHAMRNIPEFPPVITKAYSQEFLRTCTAYYIWKTGSKMPEAYTIPSKCEEAFKDISGSAKLMNVLCQGIDESRIPADDRDSFINICGYKD